MKVVESLCAVFEMHGYVPGNEEFGIPVGKA
jgi:hypothetical protein